jgi:hypothetical protein
VHTVGGTLVVTAVVLLQLRRIRTRKAPDVLHPPPDSEETAAPVSVP